MFFAQAACAGGIQDDVEAQGFLLQCCCDFVLERKEVCPFSTTVVCNLGKNIDFGYQNDWMNCLALYLHAVAVLLAHPFVVVDLEMRHAGSLVELGAPAVIHDAVAIVDDGSLLLSAEG